MPDEQNPANTEQQPGNDAEQKKQTPPWGEDFDAGKAWSLVENLRSDKTSLQTRLTALETAAQEAENAKKTDAEKLTDRATKAEKDLEAAQRAVYIERALRKHSIPDDLAEFLTGDTEDEIEKKAERLAGIGKPADSDDTEQKPEVDASGKPKPALRPGHGSDDAAPFDAAAIAKEIRGRRF